MKQILVKINTEEEFEDIQNKVFDNGGVWFSGEAKVFEFSDFDENIYALSIDMDGQGFVEDLNITYVENEKAFKELEKDSVVLEVDEVLGIDNLKEYLL